MSQTYETIRARVPIIESYHLLLVEDTTHLTPEERMIFFTGFLTEEKTKRPPRIRILLPRSSSLTEEHLLQEEGFVLHEDVVMVTRNLTDLPAWETPYTLTSLDDLSRQHFLNTWTRARQQTGNIASSTSTEDLLKSAEKELGPGYQQHCLVAYEETTPIGVLLPHIEPGTTDEGRLFDFSVLPDVRGQGHGERLHRQALRYLNEKHHASTYIGSTGKTNTPMLRTFQKNGCRVTQEFRVYHRTNK